MTEPAPPAAPPPATSPPRSFPPNSVQFLRTLEQMQVQFSQMADQKASMLMGASMVVFTIAVGQLRAGGGMMIPIAILGTTAFVSALFAILTVLPRGTASRKTIEPHDNILFFGVFSHLSQEEFADRILDGMATEESTFRMILRDMYQAGAVLHHRKYRLLGLAYRTFVSGMVLTVLAATIELATGRLI